MVYIIIPVHNRKAYTQGCLHCLEQQRYRHFQTIVVDDGSTDGTSEMIANEFPEVIVLQGDGNLWWTKAINMGVRYALDQSRQPDTDVILTLNDDLTVNPDYLTYLMADYEAKRPCLMGSVVVDIRNPNYLEYAGTSCNYYTAKSIQTASKFNHDYNQLKNNYSVIQSDDLSGRGTLIPLSIFQKIGLYDAINFPHYMGDIEFSVRARRAGYKLFISVNGVIHNYMEATRNKEQPWPEFAKGFFSFKAPNYLRIRYTFAIRHTPIKIIYFFLDINRIVAGYAIRRYKRRKTTR